MCSRKKMGTRKKGKIDTVNQPKNEPFFFRGVFLEISRVLFHCVLFRVNKMRRRKSIGKCIEDVVCLSYQMIV